jgi:hypothetical protein
MVYSGMMRMDKKKREHSKQKTEARHTRARTHAHAHNRPKATENVNNFKLRSAHATQGREGETVKDVT